MNSIKTIILSLFVIGTAIPAFAQGFNINGKVTGLKDSTWVYLRLDKPQRIVDSSMLKNGEFHLSGRIASKAEEAILFTGRYDNYVVFWLENKNIGMDVTAGKFKKGLITGSATQDENIEMLIAKTPISQHEDSLNSVFKSAKDEAAKESIRQQISKVREEGRQFDINYVKQHPASVIAANLLDVYASTWGKELASALYKGLSPEMKGSEFGRDINDFISLNKSIRIGDKYADFEQANIDGKLIKLSAIKGKYILLDFWASWCGPCREENPSLVKTYHLFKEKGFAVLGVSLDDSKADWLKAVRDDKLEWENVCDLRGDKNKAALIYGINAIPNNFLIDEHGNIVAKNLRGKDLDDKLKELLP